MIQDAAVRDLPGYNPNAAPGVQLPGPSTAKGAPHHEATRAQGVPGRGGTYGAEREIAYDSLRKAGYNPRRRHSALGYKSPNRFEEAALATAVFPSH